MTVAHTSRYTRLTLFFAENSGRDPDTGVAVEAIETLSSCDKARWLLLPETKRVLRCLAGSIEETARRTKEATACGGVLPPARDDEDDKESDADASKPPKKKKKKKKPTTFSDLCARNALLVHTLYSVTKEAERENEGSAWGVLIGESDSLIGALRSILEQARAPVEPPVGKRGTDDADGPVGAGNENLRHPNAAASKETTIELCRNVLIVIAEMTDPANARGDPEAGATWATDLVRRKPEVLDELVLIMGGGCDFYDEGVGNVKSSPCSVQKKHGPVSREPDNTHPDEPFTMSLGVGDGDGARPVPAVFAGYVPDAEVPPWDEKNDGEDVSADRTANRETDGQNSKHGYLGALAKDCAHIAAAAMFGLLSWDTAMRAFLDLEEARDAKPSVGALVSRSLALLADAVPTQTDGVEITEITEFTDADGVTHAVTPENVVDSAETSSAGGLCGVEAAGLLARLAADDEGRAALVRHAPGVVGYLLPWCGAFPITTHRRWRLPILVLQRDGYYLCPYSCHKGRLLPLTVYSYQSLIPIPDIHMAERLTLSFFIAQV